MRPIVLVVFSGTAVEPVLFDRALVEARTLRAGLVLLDIRHRQQVDRLAEYLEAESPLGRATVKALRKSVKQQRDRTIEGALEALAEQGKSCGVDVAIREEKGGFSATVHRVVQELGVTTVVLPHQEPPIELGAQVRTIRV